MKIENIDAVIFDMGGTIYCTSLSVLDMTKKFLLEIGLDECACRPDDEIRSAIQKANEWMVGLIAERNFGPRWEPSDTVWVEYDRVLLSELGITDNLDFYAKEYQQKWDVLLAGLVSDLMEDCKDVLEELKARGYLLGIASNRFDEPSGYLKRDNIEGLFGAVEFSCVPGFQKPAPYMLIMTASDLGVNPRRAVYVGNLVDYDVEAARRADMVPVLITWCNPEEEEKATPGTIVISHIRDLLDLLPNKSKR